MSKRSSLKTDAAIVMPILAPVLGEELAAAIIEHRDTLREPMTEYAAKLQVKEYIACGNPVAAAEMQILHNWTAIRSPWYFNQISKDRRTTPGDRPPRPMSDFMRGQHEIKQQLERTIYGDRDEFAGATIDIAARDFRSH